MKHKKRQGFTIVELLVVIGIIGVLAYIVLPVLNIARKKAQVAHVQAELTQIRTAVGELVAQTDLWPGGKKIDVIESIADNEIWDLNSSSSGLVSTDGSFPNWNGPYISEIPLDPWGKPYFFDTDYQVDADGRPATSSFSKVVAIGSFGPNGTGQNVYDSDDIILILAR